MDLIIDPICSLIIVSQNNCDGLIEATINLAQNLNVCPMNSVTFCGSPHSSPSPCHEEQTHLLFGYDEPYIVGW